MLVNVGQAKTELSKLLARVEAGADVRIARDGPVARLVQIPSPPSAGARFLAARGSLARRISLSEDLDFTDAEVEDMLDDGLVATPDSTA
jgi:antitoxin (DNA-binding transcriptional repressor) of toxin-antitoxin stability system